MRKIYILLFLPIILLLSACTFKPDGEHFEELDSTGKVPDIEVDLNFNTDTIYIRSNEWLYFSYKLNGEQVNWAQFTIAGKETSRFEDKSGGVELRWYFDGKESGTFPLEMKLFTRSQTGSIGDKVGSEGFLLSHTWTLVIKDSWGMGAKMAKTEFVDGALKVSWDEFKGIDFKNYKLYKDIDFTQQSRFLVATINLQEQTSFVDQTFHGEPSKYFVVTNDQYYSTQMNVTGPLPDLVATNNAVGGIQLTWKKPPFYKNLKGYRILFRDENGEMQTLATINDTSVESYTIPFPRFAYYYDFYLTLMPLSNNFYDEWNLTHFLSSKASATYGELIPKFYNVLGGLAPISYLYDFNKILVFDNEKFSVVSTIDHNSEIGRFDVSSNNKYLVSVLYTHGRIYLDDLSDPDKSKLLDLSSVFPHLGHIASVSDFGTGVVLNDQTAILYNYLTETKLAEIQLVSNGLYGNKTSPSGNFFFCETYTGYEYFQYKDNQIKSLPQLNENTEYVLHADYIPGVNEKLVRAFDNRVELLDCKTWTIEKQWMFPNKIIEAYNVDMKSGKLLLREGNTIVLFNPENGTKELLATTGNTVFLNKWNLFYNNGQLLWGEGRGINLNKTNL